MFNDINKVTLIGNITNDLEVRSTQNGTTVLSFGLATNRSYKQDEEWKDETTFHNLVAFGKTAENLSKYAQKGTRLYVSGRLQTRSWEDSDSGKTMYRTEIIVDEISLLARYKGKEDVESQPDVEETIDPESLLF